MKTFSASRNIKRPSLKLLSERAAILTLFERLSLSSSSCLSKFKEPRSQLNLFMSYTVSLSHKTLFSLVIFMSGKKKIVCWQESFSYQSFLYGDIALMSADDVNQGFAPFYLCFHFAEVVPWVLLGIRDSDCLFHALHSERVPTSDPLK